MQYANELAALSGRVGRNLPLEILQNRCDALANLRTRVENAYLTSLSEEEMSATESSFERHIQNSNIDHQIDNAQERGLKQTGRPNQTPDQTTALMKIRRQLETARRNRSHQVKRLEDVPDAVGLPAPIPLASVLKACPQIRDYARDDIADWRDLVQTAGLVRSMLGVSPDAWDRARNAMGEVDAAITMAAILERLGDIRSPGGYLRALTERAEKGLYSVLPVLKSLKGESRATPE